jgi:hypothetical protein
VFDVLVLIVPLAAAIPITESFLRNELRTFLFGRPIQSWIMDFLDWAPVIFFGLLPRYVSLGMVALLFLRLRRPRPGLRRVSRQPGAVACAAGTAAVVAGGVIVLSRHLFSNGNPLGMISTWPPWHELYEWPMVEARISAAVVAAWTALGLSGRWRSEPSWIDRAGRVMGAYWVCLWLLRWYFVLHVPES